MKKSVLFIGIIFLISFASASSLYLNKGWNLVSFESLPQDSSVNQVFENSLSKIVSVWGYEKGKWDVYLDEGKTDEYVGGKNHLQILTEMKYGKSYWINSKESFSLNLCVIDCKDSSTTILTKGWNLIGVNSDFTADSFLNDVGKENVESIWGWDASKQKWHVIQPKKSDKGKSYASGKGFNFLENINVGKGYWVNYISDTNKVIGVCDAKPEVCNGIDDDCNGQTDDFTGYIKCDGIGYSNCKNGKPQTCADITASPKPAETHVCIYRHQIGNQNYLNNFGKKTEGDCLNKCLSKKKTFDVSNLDTCEWELGANKKILPM
ncbi:MAG: putative metal-binding motif-containing protein [archaeon]